MTGIPNEMNYEGSRSVICNPVKSEITNYFDKNVANGQKTRKSQVVVIFLLIMVILPKMVKSKFFNFFNYNIKIIFGNNKVFCLENVLFFKKYKLKIKKKILIVNGNI